MRQRTMSERAFFLEKMNSNTFNSASIFCLGYQGRYKPSWTTFIFCLLITCLFSFTATTPATAATYYLDAVDGNDANPGTSEEPWQTINRAKPNATSYNPYVVSGDTVILRGGYYGQIAWGGISNTDWITYIAEDLAADPPLFQGLKLTSSTDLNTYLIFDGVRFPWTITGQGNVGETRAENKAIYLFPANYFKLRNCYIEGDADSLTAPLNKLMYVRGKTNPAIYIEIDSCEFYNSYNGIQLTDVGKSGITQSGIYVHDSKIHHFASDAFTGLKVNESRWEDNEIGNCWILGNVYIEDGDVTVQGEFNLGDTITQAATGKSGILKFRYNNGYQVDGDLQTEWNNTAVITSSSGGSLTPTDVRETDHSDLVQLYTLNDSIQQVNNVFRRNKFYDSYQGIFLKECTNVLIENNLWYGTFYTQHSCTLHDGCVSGTIRNNTFVQTIVNSSTAVAIYSNGTYGDTFNLYNNIICGAVYLTDTFGQTLNNGNNVLGGFAGTSGLSPDSSNLVYGHYPLTDVEKTGIFADWGNNDYQLKNGSPAISFGNTEHAPANDILGNSRDANPDAGCYEYVSSDPNNDPVLQDIGNKSVNENSVLTFDVNATDPNGDTIIYSVLNLPSGATFASQTFSWTPGYDQAGSYDVTFIAGDGTAQDSEMITITVNNTNRAPVLETVGNQSVNENSTLNFSINATDADSDTITYSVTDLPTGAAFTGQTFTWTPGYDQAGTHQVTFTASDGQAQDPETITITVNNINRAPVLDSIGNKSVYTESSLSFTISATDADSDTITYSATGLPSGATLASQSFSWTPGQSQTGSHQLTFTASDSQTQDSETITITVTADTSAPSVSDLSPAADSIQAPLNTLITLHIVDAGKGVDANLVSIKVNDNIVYTGNTDDYSSGSGHCHRMGTKANYTFIYQADEMLDFDQTVSVTANATDLAGNPMDQYSYSFKTEMRSFGKNKQVSSGSFDKGKAVTARNSAGDIWTVWHTGQTGSRDIYIGKLAAGADSFSDSVQITNNDADQCNPTIATDSADKLYVAWQDSRNGEWDIYVSTSTDGTSFSTERKITDPNSDQINPAMAIDSANKVYIVWEDDRNNNKDIYTASSNNSFVSYATSQITSNASEQTTPAIAVDSDNTVYVVWTDARGGTNDIYGAASNNSWTNAAIVNNVSNQSNPAIATESAGSILHLLWVDDTAGDNDIYYVASDGLPSSPLSGSSIIDDDSGSDQLQPAIAVTGSTGNDLKVFACWKDQRDTDTDLYFVQTNSNTGTNVFIGDDSTNANQSQPAMATDIYGYPYLVWTDSRNTNADIYYAGSTFVESSVLASKEISTSSDTTVGTVPAAIDEVDDVSVIVPAGAHSCDITITISRVTNQQKLTLECFSLPYEFGPSGINFTEPVTITIPYEVSDSSSSTSAYWYNPLTGTLSQDGITDVENIVISSTLHALRFRTTHFTQFLVGGGIVAVAAGGGGGGGCSISPNSQGSIAEFILPYIALSVAMTILKLRDRRKKKVRKITESKC